MFSNVNAFLVAEIVFVFIFTRMTELYGIVWALTQHNVFKIYLISFYIYIFGRWVVFEIHMVLNKASNTIVEYLFQFDNVFASSV